MKMAKRRTDAEKILRYLGTGKQLTRRVAEGQLKIGNVAGRVHELRSNGWVIFTNTRKVNGKKVFQYRLSTDQQSVASLLG
jgi:hypothetical protein